MHDPPACHRRHPVRHSGNGTPLHTRVPTCLAHASLFFAPQLVESIEHVRESSGIREEWFGLILLPFVSFSADGAVAVIFFCQAVYDRIANKEVQVPSMLARGRAIDLSIQFTLLWMPFLVLLGWWTSKPMHLLFGQLLTRRG